MSEKLKIKTGDLDLIESKTFFPYNDHDTIIDLITSDGKLSIILKFKNSEKDTDKISKSSRVINETTLEITFTNYNHSMGSFTLKPWKIGDSGNRELLLVYSIYGLNESEFKRMDIAFYLGKEVKNG